MTPRAPRFYSEARLREGTTCALPEESAHHAVRVLRLRAGDDVTLFDGHGGEYGARIASIERTRVAIDVLDHRGVERESPLRVLLVQGVSSGERMDFTVRKAVELGVAEIHPVIAAASVARPKGERAAARHEHWQRIAIAACEQCGRNRIPKVLPLVPLSGYRAQGDGLKLLLSPLSRTALSKIAVKGDEFVIAAGPEAGFNSAEEAALVQAGFVPVQLGARILRTETAALAALAALNALRGDF
ncbi:MAG TPA: 16S rRNA (uracil(1498)-N(3))-methyltransferase [Burkholderiales bacterium]|nr:16S rRNA (uracil(1498)-N(3))-methyltransferase [Burkholderiales bacterium]